MKRVLALSTSPNSKKEKRDALRFVRTLTNEKSELIELKTDTSRSLMHQVGDAVGQLSDADLVYFFPGWENSKFLQAVHNVAVIFNYIIIEESS